jgi:hypothetical protein
MPLPAAWTSWLTENLLRGAHPDRVIERLVAEGLPREQANGQVLEVLGSPIFQGARRLVLRSAGVEQAARLRRSFDCQATFEADELSDDAFRSGPWSGHRPQLLRGVAGDWPARSWTLSLLRERVGDVVIEVLRGRAGYRRWWAHRAELNTTMPLSELLDLMEGEPSNDVYAVGRNDLLATPGLESLASELGPLPGLHPERSHDRLWVGPAGTLTPLHHDQSAAWLVQLVGRKRVWLASPLEPSLLDSADGVFNLLDPREVEGEATEVHWIDVVLEPGDAVFLPTGWWHQVLALDASISVSRGAFRETSTRDWYAPGRFNRPDVGEAPQ